MSSPRLGHTQSDAPGSTKPIPVLFVSHGSPMAAVQDGPYGQALESFGRSVSPGAILVISAHWEESGSIRVNSAKKPQLIYDFGGFPRALYELKYDAPGSPSLARQAQAALREVGADARLESDRGWDHGLWVPLRLMFPEARIPAVEVSLPANSSPEHLLQIGKALAVFRRKGVLVLGSGGLVHNLYLFRAGSKDGALDAWAQDFEEWVRRAIQRSDLEALFSYRRLAPNADLAVPTPEHFAPLFVVLGAAHPYSKLVSIFDGFEYANMSMGCFALE